MNEKFKKWNLLLKLGILTLLCFISLGVLCFNQHNALAAEFNNMDAEQQDYKSFTVDTDSGEQIHYYPIWNGDVPPAGIEFYFKNKHNDFVQIDPTNMSSLTEYKDNLYYINKGNNSITAVAINEENFDEAFGEKAAITEKDNYAKSYDWTTERPTMFKDKGATCEALNWKKINEGSFCMPSDGEPTINSVGINSIDNAYFSKNIYFSCVSNVDNPEYEAYIWICDINRWSKGMDRGPQRFSIVFSRQFQ